MSASSSYDEVVQFIDEQIAQHEQAIADHNVQINALTVAKVALRQEDKPVPRKPKRQPSTDDKVKAATTRPARRKSSTNDDEHDPTDRQLYWLERMGYTGDTDELTRRQASEILEKLFADNDDAKREAVDEVKSQRPRRKSQAESGNESSRRAANVKRAKTEKKVKAEAKTNGKGDNDETMARQIEELTEEGLSPKEISEETGAAISYVYLIRRRYTQASK